MINQDSGNSKSRDKELNDKVSPNEDGTRNWDDSNPVNRGLDKDSEDRGTKNNENSDDSNEQEINQ